MAEAMPETGEEPPAQGPISGVGNANAYPATLAAYSIAAYIATNADSETRTAKANV